MAASAGRPPDMARALHERNRRTALALVSWIALLALVAVSVAWLRN